MKHIQLQITLVPNSPAL